MGLTLAVDVIRDEQIAYIGKQLRSHWIYERYANKLRHETNTVLKDLYRRMLSDAAVAFVGPCDVKLTELADIEDSVNDAPIFSPLMLHVIIDLFSSDLHRTVYQQRMLIVLAKEIIERRTAWLVERSGDDIYVTRPDGSRGKLSVSIASAGSMSTLIHTGLNIRTEGTPVPTVGLDELGIEPIAFAEEWLARYQAEVEDIYLARCKVKVMR